MRNILRVQKALSNGFIRAFVLFILTLSSLTRIFYFPKDIPCFSNASAPDFAQGFDGGLKTR